MKTPTKKREHCSHAYCGICMNKGKIERDAEELEFLEDLQDDEGSFALTHNNIVRRIAILEARTRQ